MRSILPLLCCWLMGWPGQAAAQDTRARRARSPQSACDTVRTQDVIEGIGSRGEITLASGRVAMLSGLRVPEQPEDAARFTAWASRRKGQSVEVATLGAKSDRWGRVRSVITILDEAEPVDLAGAAIEAGLALVDAGPADTLCRPALLAIEAAARTKGVGLWAADAAAPVAAEDAARLRSLVGTFALAEGRIRSIGERPQRTYLNFGADWSKSLTITIPKRTWRIMLDRGLSAATLKGRRVRARGIVEDGRGPSIDLTAVEMLEILNEDGAPRR